MLWLYLLTLSQLKLHKWQRKLDLSLFYILLQWQARLHIPRSDCTCVLMRIAASLLILTWLQTGNPIGWLHCNVQCIVTLYCRWRRATCPWWPGVWAAPRSALAWGVSAPTPGGLTLWPSYNTTPTPSTASVETFRYTSTLSYSQYSALHTKFGRNSEVRSGHLRHTNNISRLNKDFFIKPYGGVNHWKRKFH